MTGILNQWTTAMLLMTQSFGQTIITVIKIKAAPLRNGVQLLEAETRAQWLEHLEAAHRKEMGKLHSASASSKMQNPFIFLLSILCSVVSVFKIRRCLWKPQSLCPYSRWEHKGSSKGKKCVRLPCTPAWRSGFKFMLRIFLTTSHFVFHQP